MTLPADLGGLRTDQAPPLSIPASFFLLAPVAMVAAGAVLLAVGEEALGSTWSPWTLALLHLGTLGVAGSVMLGALYQMAPVVAGAPVPGVRLAHGVHAAFAAGTATLVWALASRGRVTFWVAVGLLSFAFAAFVAPMGAALIRAPSRTTTVDGMRVALAALVTVAAFGLYLGYRRAGPGTTDAWMQLRMVHGTLGLLCWIGGLLTSVSWQVVPMFYLAPPPAARAQRLVLGLVAASLVLLPGAALIHPTDVTVAAAALPAAVGVWLVHPAVISLAIARRRRRRQDPSLLFWRAGMLAAPWAFGAAVAVMAMPDAPSPPIHLAWIALWGWAGLVIHGMLTRIVPFLVWFHRFSRLVGRQPVPAMKQLFPERRARAGLALHLATLALGAGAIATANPWLARATGVGLAATGLQLGAALVLVLRRRS